MKAICPVLTVFPLACGGGVFGEEEIDFTLQLEPLVARNQPDLFSEFEALELQIQHGDGTVDRHMLTNLSSGSESEIGSLSSLDRATLALVGLDGIGTEVGIGRTEPITMESGELSQAILVTRLDSMAELAPLNDDRMGASLVATGDGVFLLFGGSKEYADDPGSINPSPSGFSDVLEIRLGDIDNSLEFQVVGEMPPRDGGTGGCDEHECDRVNFSATRLSSQHEDKGKILVIGGAYDYLGSSSVTAAGFLWDPETHTAEVLDGNDAQLLQPTFFHTGTEGPQGNVVLAGGSVGSIKDLYFTPRSKVEVYDPFTRELSLAGGVAEGSLIWHAAARLGDEGVLLCGGTSFNYSSSYPLSTICDLVDVSGSFVDLEAEDMLPIGLVHHQMTTLADGRILVTGGFSSDTDSLAVDGFGSVNALGSSRAFVYDGDAWVETGSMSMGRGGHAATLLPDGRVLIAGGEDTTDNLFPDGYQAIACAEVFDPDSFGFSPLSGCTSSSSAGDLSLPTSFPSVDSDPVFGALVVGGMDTSATDQVMLFTVSAPE
jgi:hypothetical protein